MAQPNPPPGFATRAMPPVRNPVYVYNDDSSFKQTNPPVHVLERPPQPARESDRRTVAGSVPSVAGLTPIVPMAAQTPLNVWALYPQ